MTAKLNRARGRRCTGGKLQQRRWITIPVNCSVGCPQPRDLGSISAWDSGHYSGCFANLQGGVALAFVDGLIKQENNEPLAEAGDENRWPILVIADLHRHDTARRQRVDRRF